MKLKRGDDVTRGIVRQDLIDISAENENYVDPAVAGGRYYSHCDPCNKSFIRPGDLKRHNNYCHGGQLELRNDTLYPPGQHAPAHVEEEEVITTTIGTTSNQEMVSTTTSKAVSVFFFQCAIFFCRKNLAIFFVPTVVLKSNVLHYIDST